MQWRRWLIDVPALMVDGWFIAYRLVLTVVTMITVTTVSLLLVLALLGIRWGW